MCVKTDLLRHEWPSSRREDENFVDFSLVEDCIVISFSCLWDADEDEVSDGTLSVPIFSFVGAIQGLSAGVSRSVGGIEPRTYVSFYWKGEDQIDMTCSSDGGGTTTSIPYAKLMEVVAQLN
jgi:hypothetical protein